MTPPWIRGVFNLRGGALPGVALAAKFGATRGEITPRTCIVIVETLLGGETVLMGLVADAVNEVMELKPEDIEPPPSFGTRVRVEYLQGLAKAEKRLVLLLDIDRVLSSDELSTVAGATAKDVAGTTGKDAEAVALTAAS
jgi:purine-binding chemotaxis protein CheW